MFFSKKIFLRFLSLRYGADFGRSRLFSNFTRERELFGRYPYQRALNPAVAKLKEDPDLDHPEGLPEPFHMQIYPGFHQGLP